MSDLAALSGCCTALAVGAARGPKGNAVTHHDAGAIVGPEQVGSQVHQWQCFSD